MIASIRKKHVLETVGPADFAAYLRSHNWTQTEQLGDKATVWTKPSDRDEDYEVVLPIRRSVADYAARIGDAIETLSIEEHRDERLVFHDITITNADILRVGVRHPLIGSGSIPLEFAVIVVTELRNAVSAAANATLVPKSLYHKRMSRDVEHYTGGLRLSQMESDGFTLALESDVPPMLRREGSDPGHDTVVDMEPFARRAMLCLRDALAALERALIRSAPTGTATPFQESIDSGVSAELCDAIVALGIGGTADELSFQFNWATTRPVATTAADTVRFGRDAFPVLAEAARILREAPDQSTAQKSGVSTIVYPVGNEAPVSAVREEPTPLTTTTPNGPNTEHRTPNT